jgi:hypothetical protein
VPTVADVAENPSVDVFALGVPTNDRATGDEPAVPLPDWGVYTTADPANVTAAENVPTLAAVYVTDPTPDAFVFVVAFTVNPVPDDPTTTPDNGLPYLSNAYTSTSSTPPPASWLSIRTSNRVRWLFGTDVSGAHPDPHKLPAVNVTAAPEPDTAEPPTFAVTATCSAFVSVNVTVHVPFVPVVQFVDDAPLNLPDPFTAKSTRTPDKATLFAFFAVAVTVTDDPTVVEVVDTLTVDFDAFAVPTNVTDTGDDDPVPLPPAWGVNTTAVPSSVTVAE